MSLRDKLKKISYNWANISTELTTCQTLSFWCRWKSMDYNKMILLKRLWLFVVVKYKNIIERCYKTRNGISYSFNFPEKVCSVNIRDLTHQDGRMTKKWDCAPIVTTSKVMKMSSAQEMQRVDRELSLEIEEPPLTRCTMYVKFMYLNCYVKHKVGAIIAVLK